jgi:hypothetical protein
LPQSSAFYNIREGVFVLFLDKIIDALSDFAVKFPQKNRENRKEIRKVVLSVQTEMERAVELAILYIDGTKRIVPDQELIDHLKGASSNFMNSYNEFKICAGLYGLADRFDEVFCTIKGAINIGQIKEVEAKKIDAIQRMDPDVSSMRSQLDVFRKSVKEIRKRM